MYKIREDVDLKELKKFGFEYDSSSKFYERKLEDKYKELDKMCELHSKSLYNAELNQYKDNWNKLKEYFNERIKVCDNRLSSPFCNFEKATKERLIFSQCLEKLEELERNNERKWTEMNGGRKWNLY